jgi:hypothetical protein
MELKLRRIRFKGTQLQARNHVSETRLICLSPLNMDRSVNAGRLPRTDPVQPSNSRVPSRSVEFLGGSDEKPYSRQQAEALTQSGFVRKIRMDIGNWETPSSSLGRIVGISYSCRPWIRSRTNGNLGFRIAGYSSTWISFGFKRSDRTCILILGNGFAVFPWATSGSPPTGSSENSI